MLGYRCMKLILRDIYYCRQKVNICNKQSEKLRQEGNLFKYYPEILEYLLSCGLPKLRIFFWRSLERIVQIGFHVNKQISFLSLLFRSEAKLVHLDRFYHFPRLQVRYGSNHGTLKSLSNVSSNHYLDSPFDPFPSTPIVAIEFLSARITSPSFSCNFSMIGATPYQSWMCSFRMWSDAMQHNYLSL